MKKLFIICASISIFIYSIAACAIEQDKSNIKALEDAARILKYNAEIKTNTPETLKTIVDDLMTLSDSSDVDANVMYYIIQGLESVSENKAANPEISEMITKRLLIMTDKLMTIADNPAISRQDLKRVVLAFEVFARLATDAATLKAVTKNLITLVEKNNYLITNASLGFKSVVNNMASDTETVNMIAKKLLTLTDDNITFFTVLFFNILGSAAERIHDTTTLKLIAEKLMASADVYNIRPTTMAYIEKGLKAIFNNKTTDDKTRKLVKDKLEALNVGDDERNLSTEEIEILMKEGDYPLHTFQAG